MWCKVEDISQSYIGLTYSPKDVSSQGTIVLRSSNIQNGKIDLTDIVRVSKEIPSKLVVNANDIIICARNGSKKLVGKSAIVPHIQESFTFEAFMAICKTPLFQYVHLFLLSDLFFSQLEDVTGTTTIYQLTQNRFNSFLLPLPPLKEQERIANEIGRLFALIDQLEEDKESLQQLITQLKSKILSLAIRGQLVPQDANDEPAEALLKQIKPAYKSSGNLHYKNLPKGWAMCKLGEVCEAERGITFPSSAKKFQFEEGTIACLRTANVQELLDIEDLWYIDESYLKGNKRKYIQIGDDMMSTANSRELVGKVSFVRELDKPMSFGGFIMALRAKGIHSEYLYIVLRTLFLEGYFSKIASQTTNIANLNTRNLNEIDILLPPLAEQQRISEKITELFNIIDTIQNALNS